MVSLSSGNQPKATKSGSFNHINPLWFPLREALSSFNHIPYISHQPVSTSTSFGLPGGLIIYQGSPSIFPKRTPMLKHLPAPLPDRHLPLQVVLAQLPLEPIPRGTGLRHEWRWFSGNQKGDGSCLLLFFSQQEAQRGWVVFCFVFSSSRNKAKGMGSFICFPDFCVDPNIRL